MSDTRSLTPLREPLELLIAPGKRIGVRCELCGRDTVITTDDAGGWAFAYDCDRQPEDGVGDFLITIRIACPDCSRRIA